MGYNGNNRKLNRGYKGFSKSSIRRGNSILFGRRGVLSGILNMGGALLNDTANSSIGINSVPTTNGSDSDKFIGCLVLFIASIGCFILGSWIVDYVAFIGLICFGFGALMIIYLIFLLVNEERNDKSKEMDIAKAREQYPFEEIDEDLAQKLADNYYFERHFHFTRPLLTEEEYGRINFSSKFRMKYYLYEGYKEQWEESYWKYSFELKMHELLKTLLKEDFFNIKDYNDEPYKQFIRNRIIKLLNHSERLYFSRIILHDAFGSVGSFMSWYRYRDLWMTNQYEPEKIEKLLEEDLTNRMLEVKNQYN